MSGDHVHVTLRGTRVATVLAIDCDRLRSPRERTIDLAGAAEKQIFGYAYKAVLKATGAPPTHFLVGWHDYLELSITRPAWVAVVPRMPGDDTPLIRYAGVELVVDSRAEHMIVAVPALRHALTRKPVPLGAAWQWSAATGWTRRPQQ